MSPRLFPLALPFAIALALAAAVPMHAHAKKAEAAGAESEFRATGEDYVNEVNEPWLEPLSELRRSMKPGRNYVFWIISPPQEPLDLRSAEHFRRFINANSSGHPSISHNMVAWSCGRNEGAVGMTGETQQQALKMLKGGFGLTTFFSVFTDGIIDGTDTVTEVAEDLSKKTGLVVLGVEVEAAACSQMVSFLNSFLRHPREPFRKFGLTVSPERMEGGGCISLATTLLKKAGIFTDLLPLADRELLAPEALMGGNMAAPENASVPRLPWLKGEAKSIGVGRLLKTPWASDKGGIPLRLPDPELLIVLMQSIWETRLAALPATQAAAERAELARTALGTRVVRSGSDDAGASTSLSIRYVPINERFDAQTARMAKAARGWTARNRPGAEIRRGSLMGSPVIVIDRK